MRAPAVSGRFYPSGRAELEAEVRELCDAVRTGPPGIPPTPAIGIIVPHAGYVFSGITAAHVFTRVALPRLVVVIAPNHTGEFTAAGGASLWSDGAFTTPLGSVPVDAEFGRALCDTEPLVEPDTLAHRAEHAVEVELPFLQVLRPDVRIVPLVLAFDAWEACRALGDSLARLVGRWPEPVLLLASSDLSHYEPAAATEAKDRRALDAIAALDGGELLRRCRAERISMCGRAPAATVLAAATTLGAETATVVDYRHSGHASGDFDSVVGYAGVVIA